MSFAERQTPAGDEIFLDHVGWFVADIAAAARDFERLGFVLTPYTRHVNAAADGRAQPSGTANRCAMLERGYLELLTDVAGIATPLARDLRAARARYGGVHLLAFSCADADAQHARIAASGLALQPLVHLRRAVETAEGGSAVTAFSVIRTAPAAMAEGRIQMLVQETPALVWQDRFIARANAIDALTGVLLCVADPAEAASRFARFLGKPARREGGMIRIALDRGAIAFAAPEQARAVIPRLVVPALPFIAAVALRSRDLDATGRTLGAAADARGSTLWVPPDRAAGAWIAVTAGAAAWG